MTFQLISYRLNLTRNFIIPQYTVVLTDVRLLETVNVVAANL